VIGRDRAAGLADVMMLVSLDTARKSICVAQIPRDTYAEYGDLSHSKLNAALKLLGGERALCDYLSGVFGVSIDGYLSMDLDGFRHIVDAVGGVEIELDRDLFYSDPYQGLYIDLKKGKQVLDGRAAEMLVRYRSGYAGGDVDRLDVQKLFLSALFAQLKQSVNADNAYGLVNSLTPYVDTDLGVMTAVALGLEALSVDSSELYMLTLPGGAAVSPKSGASYYVIAAEATREVMERYFSSEDVSFDPRRLLEHPSYAEFGEIYRSGESEDTPDGD
jgi:LCP family protein required for cell wall assembly